MCPNKEKRDIDAAVRNRSLASCWLGAAIYHFSSPVYEAEASIALKHKDDAIIAFGASCIR